MDFAVLDWQDSAFRLDHREFAYAGKFVMPSGKAAALEPDALPIESQPGPREGSVRGVVAAVAFSPDRTDPSTLWFRYITVRTDRRGEGIGPRLAAFVAERAAERGYERVQIAVNNPFAYDACYKASFTYTGTDTGLAELVLRRPAGEIAGRDEGKRSIDTYCDGLDVYRERDLSPAERAFCERTRERGPPPIVDVPA